MTRRATAFAEALLAVALVTWVAASQLPLLGLASAALLFLLTAAAALAADSKISALPGVGTLHTDDLFIVVDTHDTSLAPTGTDKKLTPSQLFGQVNGLWSGAKNRHTGRLETLGQTKSGLSTQLNHNTNQLTTGLFRALEYYAQKTFPDAERDSMIAERILPFCVLIGAMSCYLGLSRRLELVIARSAGMSAWQFVRPGLFVAFWIGVLSVLAYNPLAAAARAESASVVSMTTARMDLSARISRKSRIPLAAPPGCLAVISTACSRCG